MLSVAYYGAGVRALNQIAYHGCLACAQARSSEVVSLSREVAELMERTEAAEAAADRYEAKYRSSKAELQQAQASCAQQSSEIEELSEALAHEQTAARTDQEAFEQLSSKLSAVQVQRHQRACGHAQSHTVLLATPSFNHIALHCMCSTVRVS